MAKRKFYQKKRFLFPFAIILAFVILSVFGAFHSSLYQTTTNAYVDDYLVKIYPKISSKIMELNIENNSDVKKGEILAELDGSEYTQKIKELEDKFNHLQNELNNTDKEIKEINLKANKNKDIMEKAKVNLENANYDYVRYKNEYKDGTVTKKDLNNAIENLKIAQEQYQNAQNELKSTSRKLQEIMIKKNSQTDETREIFEILEETKYKLSDATIISPKNGKIINLNVKIGDIANTEEVLFTIKPEECFVIANFKKQANNTFKTGQKATVKIYSIGFSKLNGEVVEVLDENSNYIPVKIKLSDNVQKYNIKTGAKAYARVKVK